MHHIRISLLVAFVLVFGGLTSPVFAQEEPEIPTSTAGEVTSIRIADVAVRDTRLISQTGTEAQISFTIKNGEGTQSGVKIAVELREKSEEGGRTMDFRVQDGVFTLTPQSSLEKTVTYHAPPFLKGDYELWIFLGNEAGVPLGSTRATGTMKLFGSGQYIELSACTLSVSSSGENVLPKTSASGNVPPPIPKSSGSVLTAPDGASHVTCKATNHFTEAKTVAPFFVTFKSSPYGPLVSTASVENTPVTLKLGQSKPISFVLPKPKTPGTYSVTLTLTADNRSLSNTVSFSHTVSGLSASIDNLSADKSAYKRGESAKITLVWSSNIGTQNTEDKQSKLFLDLSLVDGNGRECGKPISGVALERGVPSFELPITENCVAPMVLARISDEKGRLLAQKTAFLSDTKEAPLPEAPARMTLVFIVVGLLVLLALIIMVYEKMKKNTTATLMKLFLFLIITMSAFGSWGAERAYAETFSANDGLGSTFTVQLNQAEYSPGENIRVQGWASIFDPSNGCENYTPLRGWSLNATINGETKGIVSGGSGSCINDYISAYGQTDFTAPTAVGTYQARFDGEVRARFGGGSGSGNISYRVVQPPPAAAKLEVSPDINFGNVPVGETRSAGFTVSNSGSGNLSGSVALLPFVRSLAKLPFVREALALSYPFSFMSGASYNLASNGSTNIGVAFSPPTAEYYQSPAYFRSNGGNVDRVVDGQGTGGSIDPCLSVPRPSAWISVDPDYVDYGGEATLSWSSSDATSCTLDGSGVGTPGSRGTGSLTDSRSYELSCSNSCYSGGNAAYSSASITVGDEPPPADGAYVSLWANDYSISSGESITLYWDSRDVSNCYASGGWDGGKNTSGDEPTGALYNDTTFRITCDDNQNGGTLSDSVFIQIASAGSIYGCTDPSANNYNPNATIDDGSCDYTLGSGLNFNFSADPDIVAQGQTSTLYGRDIVNADRCYADSDNWSGDKSIYGFEEVTNSLSSDTDYSLTCENDTDTLTRSTTITIDASRNPSLDFWSDKLSVPYDSGTTLHWNAQNVNSCIASGGWSGEMGSSGEKPTGNLTSPTTYNLECSGSYGSVSGQVRVQVQPTFFLDNSNNIKVTVVKGKPAKSSATTLTIDRRLSFSQPVTFSVSDINPPLPGATFNFTPKTLDSSEYSTGALFTVTAPGNTAQRDYTITVSAQGGGVTRSVDVIMGVTVIDPNFKEF